MAEVNGSGYEALVLDILFEPEPWHPEFFAIELQFVWLSGDHQRLLVDGRRPQDPADDAQHGLHREAGSPQLLLCLLQECVDYAKVLVTHLGPHLF